MRYVERVCKEQWERYNAVANLLHVDDLYAVKFRREVSPALDGVLRWYTCDVASEAMRLYGNGDLRSLQAIEVGRLYAQGKAGENELKQARQDAFEAAADVVDVVDAVDAAAYAADVVDAVDAAAYAASFAAGAGVAYAAADDAAYAAASYAAYADAVAEAAYAAGTYGAWDRAHREKRALLTDWLRAYLVRWIEEGDWWEVSS